MQTDENVATTKVTYRFAAATAALGALVVNPQSTSTAQQEEPAMLRTAGSAGQQSTYVDEKVFEARIDALKADTLRHIEVAEARTDTKFAQLMSKIDSIAISLASLDSKVEGVNTEVVNVKGATASVKWNIVATGLALGGLVFGLFAFGGQMFDIAAGLVNLKQ